MSSRPRVPQELADMVVDHLHDDKQTLSACSLVSTHWLDTSRLHLFYDLSINLSDESRSFSAFTNFLNSVPSIGAYVHRLRLHQGCDSTDPLAFFTAIPKAQTRISAGHLARILVQVPKLHALLLDSVCIAATEPDTRGHSLTPSTLKSYDLLTSITLTNIRIEQSVYAGKHLVDVFALFSRVKELKVRNLSTSFFPFPDPFRVFRIDDVVPDSQPRKMRVESLALDMSITTREYADVIHRSLDLRGLTSFSATCMQIEELPDVGRVVRDAAQTLTHFEFNLRDSIIDDMPTHSNWRELQLASCTSLTSLTLHFMLEGYPFSSSASQYTFNQALDILSTVPEKAPLSRLAFNIIFLGESEDMQLGALDWSTLRTLLRRFTGLRNVEFWSCDARLAGVLGRGNDGAVPICGLKRRMIETELKDWKENGALRIT